MAQPHEILQIPPNATADEIEAAYRRLKMYSDPSNVEYRNSLDAARDAMLQGLTATPAPAQTQAPNTPLPVSNALPPQPIITTPERPTGNRMQTIMIACILLIVALTSAYVVWYLHSQRINPVVGSPQPEQTQATAQENGRVAAVAQKVLPSTVTIGVFDDGDVYFGHGSGFFVNRSGDVLTNYHVVKDAPSIVILTKDDKEYTAGIRAFDEARDIALLSTETPVAESIPLEINADMPLVGSEIVVVGTPRAVKYRQTVSNGIVSAIREDDGVTLVQITAPISPGSSGGPIVNLNGEVIGISEGIVVSDGTVQNINFGVSAKHFKPFIAYAQNAPTINLRAKTHSQKRKPEPQYEEDADDIYDSLVFVSEDDQYTIYWFDRLTTYSKDKSIVLIWTKWIPAPTQKENVARGLGLTEKPLGSFLLAYVFNLKTGMGAHAQTINLYYDGSIARNYAVPKYKWERIKDNKRLASFYAVWRGERPEPATEDLLPGDDLVEFEEKLGATVIVDLANCRSLPSTSAEIIGRLPKNTPVFVTQQLTRADGTVWYLIEHANGEGWMSGKLLKVY